LALPACHFSGHSGFLFSLNAVMPSMAAATTVIEMKEIKHPFKKGIKARKGIEF
jgi:ATP:corrinoid adenosyltransferase BtuR/CobO/CobP